MGASAADEQYLPLINEDLDSEGTPHIIKHTATSSLSNLRGKISLKNKLEDQEANSESLFNSFNSVKLSRRERILVLFMLVQGFALIISLFALVRARRVATSCVAPKGQILYCLSSSFSTF
jgi:hypothetical protein